MFGPRPDVAAGRAVGLFLALVLAVSLFRYAHGLAKLLVEAPFIDFAHYYTFTTVVALGLDPFDPEAVARVDRLLGIRRGTSPADYPPLFYILMRPWLSLSFRPAAAAWFGLSQAALVGTVALCLRRFPSASPVAVVAVLFVFLTYQPLIEALALGQADVLLLFLVTLAWWSLRRGHEWLVAAALAVAVHVKVQYGLLIPLLWWSGQRRAASRAAALAAFGLLATVIALGPAYPLKYFAFLLAFPEGFFSWTANLSLRGALHRLLGTAGAGWALAYGLTLAIDAVLVLTLARLIPRRLDPRATLADWVWALGLTAIPLLSPLMEEHHLVLLIFPLAVLLLAEADRPDAPWARVLLIASIVLLASRYSLARFPAFAQGWLSLLATGKLLGVAGLTWLLARRVRAAALDAEAVRP